MTSACIPGGRLSGRTSTRRTIWRPPRRAILHLLSRPAPYRPSPSRGCETAKRLVAQPFVLRSKSSVHRTSPVPCAHGTDRRRLCAPRRRAARTRVARPFSRYAASKLDAAGCALFPLRRRQAMAGSQIDLSAGRICTAYSTLARKGGAWRTPRHRATARSTVFQYTARDCHATRGLHTRRESSRARWLHARGQPITDHYAAYLGDRYSLEGLAGFPRDGVSRCAANHDALQARADNSCRAQRRTASSEHQPRSGDSCPHHSVRWRRP
jgi:hypothetical protein